VVKFEVQLYTVAEATYIVDMQVFTCAMHVTRGFHF